MFSSRRTVARAAGAYVLLVLVVLTGLLAMHGLGPDPMGQDGRAASAKVTAPGAHVTVAEDGAAARTTEGDVNVATRGSEVNVSGPGGVHGEDVHGAESRASADDADDAESAETTVDVSVPEGVVPAVGQRSPHSEAPCHDDGRNGDAGHLAHADATCAASGIGGGPVLDTPLGFAVDALSAPLLRAGCAPETAVDRAPPSLSQLQLLRL